MTRPIATTGSPPRPASRGVTQYHARNSYPPLPSGSISRPDPLFKRGNISQALLDVGALIFLFLFIVTGALSLPLAIFMLLFASF